MDNFYRSGESMNAWHPGSGTEKLQSTVISPLQIRQEVEESVKRGIEASLPRLVMLMEEAVTRQSKLLIPALIEGAFKKEFQAIPALVEEGFKRQLRATTPAVVEEANTMVPAFLPLLQQRSAPPLTSRSSPKQAESSDSRILHLKFEGTLPKALVTKDDIKEQGASLQVELHDHSGNKVEFGPESCVKVKIFVLNGDLNTEDSRTEEDISKHAVLPREGKAPLLKGKYEMSLSKGVASVSDISFTDNSKSMRNGKFRLGAQVVKGVSPGVFIKGAVSEDFKVKEHRNTFNRKQDLISMEDEVWHLVNIGKGIIHKKLVGVGVHLVKDFLQLYHNEEKAVLAMFRGNKGKLKETVEMAKLCIQSGQPIQPLETSPKQLVNTSRCTAYDKQSEGRTSWTMTDQTFAQAGSSHPSSLNPIIQSRDVVVTDQGSSGVQPDAFIHDSRRELGPKSGGTAFEKQQELLESFTTTSQIAGQADNVCVPCTAANLHLDPVIADQGVMPYQPEESPLFSICYSPPIHFLDEEISTILQIQAQISSASSIPSIYMQHPGAISFHQGVPVVHADSYLEGPLSYHFDHENPESGVSGGQRRTCRQLIPDLTASPVVPAENNHTSKLLAACYVTKAATMFMIAIKHDGSSLKKKRKFQ